MRISKIVYSELHNEFFSSATHNIEDRTQLWERTQHRKRLQTIPKQISSHSVQTLLLSDDHNCTEAWTRHRYAMSRQVRSDCTYFILCCRRFRGSVYNTQYTLHINSVLQQLFNNIEIEWEKKERQRKKKRQTIRVLQQSRCDQHLYRLWSKSTTYLSWTVPIIQLRVIVRRISHFCIDCFDLGRRSTLIYIFENILLSSVSRSLFHRFSFFFFFLSILAFMNRLDY